jgi:hypothetical protein
VWEVSEEWGMFCFKMTVHHFQMDLKMIYWVYVTCLIFWKYDNILINESISILQWSLVISNHAIWVAPFPFQLRTETYIVSDVSYSVWNTRWWPEPRKSRMIVSHWMLTMCILYSWFWHYFVTHFELRRLQWMNDELEEM